MVIDVHCICEFLSKIYLNDVLIMREYRATNLSNHNKDLLS